MGKENKKTLAEKIEIILKGFKKLKPGEKVKGIVGLTFVGFAIYLAFAILSFFVNGHADASMISVSIPEILKGSYEFADNFGGKSGVYIAEILVNKWFGIPSVGFVYIFILIGLRFWGAKKRFWHKLFKAFVGIVFLSIAFAFVFSTYYENTFVFPGGTYGLFISQWLIAMIGQLGTGLILIVATLSFLTLEFETFWPRFSRSGILVLYKSFKYLFILMAYPFKVIQKNKKIKRERKETEEKPLDEFDETIIETDPDQLIKERKLNTKEKKETIEDNSKEIIAEVESAQSIPKFDVNNFESPEEESNDPKILNIRHKETEIEKDPFDEILKEDIEEPIDLPIDNETHVTDVKEEFTFEVEKIKEDEKVEKLHHKPLENYDPRLDLSSYKFPTLSLLEDFDSNIKSVSEEELIANKNRIVETLRNYSIEITSIKATTGPTVTLYEIVPAPGIRISKIRNLEDDIALSLAALGIRIIAPIPGKGTIGIEVPNQKPQMVPMKSILSSKKFAETKYILPLALGRTISNETFVIDLAKMPHILVAGATGQGKSVGINAIITSLLFKKHPSELKFVFVDPKKVELNLYSIIEKHFLAKMPDEEEPIITDVQKVRSTLNSICVEMDQRYDLLKMAHARNIVEYNKKFVSRKLNPEKGHKFLPYIVVVVDEFADLIMTAGKEIEAPIARIAQLARAVGIHMIIATQRPSANIITGPIKANFPARISFKVASMIDSRTILDSPGANQLIGKGDMLVLTGSEMTRVQCAFIDTPEVEAVTEFIANQRGYSSAFLLPEYFDSDASDGESKGPIGKIDELFEDAARLVVLNQSGSTSSIQRRFSIGYNRAGRIMDQLEDAGVVGPSEGSKARKVLISDEYALEQMFSQEEN